jgi:hypothetical protein
MFKYSKSFEPIMNKLLVFIIIAVVGLGMIRITTMMGLSDSYAIKQSKQVPPEKTTVQSERQSQQPSEAPRATTVRPPERQSQYSPEQQEDSSTTLPP